MITNKNLPSGRTGHRMVQMGNFLYLFGGFKESKKNG